MFLRGILSLWTLQYPHLIALRRHHCCRRPFVVSFHRKFSCTRAQLWAQRELQGLIAGIHQRALSMSPQYEAKKQHLLTPLLGWGSCKAADSLLILYSVHSCPSHPKPTPHDRPSLHRTAPICETVIVVASIRYSRTSVFNGLNHERLFRRVHAPDDYFDGGPLLQH